MTMPADAALPMVSAAASLCLGGLLVRLLMSRPLRSLALDTPNARSLHQVPVPRTGGLGLLGAAFLAWAVLAPGYALPALLLALALAAVSFLDDMVALSAAMRLAVHFAAALAVVAAYPATPPAVAPLVVLTLVWMANLYNFMDGSDGLAGGMTLIGFSAYALAAHLAGAEALATVSAALAGAAAGFLIWNFPKAQIFMGDSGSVPLGFLAGALGYLGWREGVWPFHFPALVFLPFIADATVTLVRRALKRERLSEAHKTHYYQRLNRMGLGHRATALWGYALMLAAAASALTSLRLPTAAAAVVVVLWLAAIGWLMLRIDRAWAAFARADAGTPAPEVNRP